MKAISLWQPWATLIAVGAKQVETRSWSTQIRGPVAIHASKRKLTLDDKDMCSEEPFSKYVHPRLGPLPFGAVVCVASIEAVCRSEKIVEYFKAQGGRWMEDERWFGDYSPRRWGWCLKNIRPLAEPIPVKGQQGFWTLSPDEGAAIQRQIETPVAA